MKKIFKTKKSPTVIFGKRHTTKFTRSKKRKKQEKKDRRSLLWRMLFFLSFFVYGAFFVYIFFFSPLLRVNVDFSIEAQSQLQDDVKKVVTQYVQEKYLFVFPRESFFLFDVEYLQAKLQEQFPLLREIRVQKNFSDRKVSILAKEREFHIVWCPYKKEVLSDTQDAFVPNQDVSEQAQDDAKQEDDFEQQSLDDLEQNQESKNDNEEGNPSRSFDEFESLNSSLLQKEHCFSVDDSGRIHQQTDAFQEMQKNLSSIVLVGMNGYLPQENEEIFEEEVIEYFLELPLFMERNLYVPIVEVFRVPSPFADEVTVRTQEGWDIMLRTDISPEETIALLRTFFIRIADTPEIRTQLRWVDVRIPEHIYYALDENEDEDEELEEERVLEEENKREEGEMEEEVKNNVLNVSLNSRPLVVLELFRFSTKT